MTFGFFIQNNLGGILSFSHEYFKESVQTLLLGKIELKNLKIKLILKFLSKRWLFCNK